ncbi:LAGLIDADG family homing endonuclease [Micromonospora sp. WMMD812]|uniref:LAGLIDADG family homing endonuclease n=1 Tax=Micromonospora sp. WMMD812 TaxID=3015152 RepID=UPI00248D0CB2|nr:LAGLIDADG family homing endonuclease [Micromonospora sp. WMMD812]WBB67738.1 LAGLIDADG family homing endonuclease [Micromonospora sp. WMMD812]
MSMVELAWLAGLLEGEGTFCTHYTKTRGRQEPQTRVRIAVQMTDEDVVRKVQSIVGLGNVLKRKAQKDHHKDSFTWSVQAMDVVVALGTLLMPHMGERRRQQIETLLEAVRLVDGSVGRVRNHGRSKYERDGCRCEICYAAKAAANARRKRTPVPIS